MIVLLGGPASMAAFAVVRDYNAGHTLGTASGVVNVGGFVASLVTMLLVGIGLDLVGSDTGHGYALDDFRVALSVQYLIWAIGIAGILTTRRKVRARLAREGVVVPPIRDVIARRRSR